MKTCLDLAAVDSSVHVFSHVIWNIPVDRRREGKHQTTSSLRGNNPATSMLGRLLTVSYNGHPAPPTNYQLCHMRFVCPRCSYVPGINLHSSRSSEMTFFEINKPCILPPVSTCLQLLHRTNLAAGIFATCIRCALCIYKAFSLKFKNVLMDNKVTRFILCFITLNTETF